MKKLELEKNVWRRKNSREFSSTPSFDTILEGNSLEIPSRDIMENRYSKLDF